MRARPFTRICAILKPIKLTVSDVLKTTLLVKDAEVVVEISGRYFMLAHRKGSDHFQVVYVSGGRTYKTYVELTEVKLQRGSRLYFICRDTGKRCSALYFDGLNFVSAKAVPASARRLPPRKRLSPDKLLFTKKRARLLGLDGKGPARGMRRDALLLYFKERTDELSAWPDVVAELERKRRQIDRWHMGRKRADLSAGSMSTQAALRHGDRTSPAYRKFETFRNKRTANLTDYPWPSDARTVVFRSQVVPSSFSEWIQDLGTPSRVASQLPIWLTATPRWSCRRFSRRPRLLSYPGASS